MCYGHCSFHPEIIKYTRQRPLCAFIVNTFSVVPHLIFITTTNCNFSFKNLIAGIRIRSLLVAQGFGSTKMTTFDIIATYSKLITSSLSKSIERCQMSSSEEPTVLIYIQVLKNNKNAVYDYQDLGYNDKQNVFCNKRAMRFF